MQRHQERRLSVRRRSAVVNDALAEYIDRIGRRAALRRLLDQWDNELGPVSETAAEDVRAAFDELDSAA